jgi:hypothetical protein
MYNVVNYLSWDKQNKQRINDEETFSNSLSNLQYAAAASCISAILRIQKKNPWKIPKMRKIGYEIFAVPNNSSVFAQE